MKSLVLIAMTASLLSLSSKAAKVISGYKFPENDEFSISSMKSPAESTPVMTKALLPEESDFIGGMNDLLPYIVSSPDQENAGSCLFMSHTGITEVLINKIQNRTGEQRIDLSERYLMNLSKAGIGSDLIGNWKTDTIYRLNKTGINFENQDFPYLKGWYKTVNGTRVFAEANENGAYYGVRANWVIAIDQANSRMAINMPKFSREVLFADPSGNRWNVATAPSDIVNKVKNALETRKSPVLVIYNHTGFWHAVMVTGYNDSVETQGCPFVSEFPSKMRNRANEFIQAANTTSDSSERRRLQGKARIFNKRANQVEASYNKEGGCKNRGAFYVRDSIYPLDGLPLYDYDPSVRGEEKPLNPTVILREYEWLRHMANHVVQIYVPGE